jgi:hypothetical protein
VTFGEIALIERENAPRNNIWGYFGGARNVARATKECSGSDCRGVRSVTLLGRLTC